MPGIIPRQVWRQVFSWSVIVILLAGLLGLNGPRLYTAYAATFDIADGDIAALKAALTAPGTNHVINLASNGVYTLTTVDNNLPGDNGPLGNSGLPTISNTITINGNGATLVRDSAAPGFRFFIVGYTGSLTVNNLTFFNGYIDNNVNIGGAILNKGGILFLTATTFYSNTAPYGGAVANSGHGTDTISSTVASRSYTATLSVKNSTFISNTTLNYRGGAIYSSAIGGFDRAGSLVKAGDGSTSVKISGSAFISNTSGRDGTVVNSVEGGNGANGGTAVALMDISNSTFAANHGLQDNEAIANILANDAQTTSSTTGILTVTNSTVTNDVSSVGSPVVSNLKVFNTSQGLLSITLRNTILTNNGSNACYASNSVPFSAGSNNLEYTGSSGATSCGSGSTFVTTNPLVSTVPIDNGGPTKTILPTGPAIDGGDNATCATLPVNNFDQRGATRPVGAACDVGAVESGGDFVVRNNADTGDGLTVGSLSFYLKNGTNSQTILFSLTGGPTINVTGPLPPLLPNAKLGAGCDGVVIFGNGVSSDGLVLGGNNIIRGVTVKGFNGRQIVTHDPGNQLVCTKASRN